MVSKAIYSWLTTNAAVKALVDNRVYPNEPAYEAEYPQISYAERDLQLDTVFAGSATTGVSYVDLLLLNTDYAGAMILYKAVLAALDGKGGTYGGTAIEACWLEDTQPSNVIDAESDEVQYSGFTLTFRVLFHI
jgi:hypothetical protein